MSYTPSPQTKLAVWTLVLIIIVLISSQFLKGPFSQLKFPVLNLTSKFSFNFENSNLSKVIEKDLQGSEGKFAIYIEDIESGEKYELNAHDKMPSASLYKVFMMGAALKEVEDGNMKMDTVISRSKSELTNILGEVDYGYEDYGSPISFTLEEILTRIGRISDNFAAIMLGEQMGWEKAQSLADSIGTTETIIKSPIQTSAADVGLFFKKVAQRELVSRNVSEEFERFLSLNQINNRIPIELPKDIKVIHKTGELPQVRHDAGIVYLKKQVVRDGSPSAVLKPYVIVLMSEDITYEDTTNELLAKISKSVYEYFLNKK